MIYINDKTRISKLDDFSLQIEVLRKIHGKNGEEREEWKWYGYYGDLASALVGVYKKQLYDSTEQKLLLEDVISYIDKTTLGIKEVVKQISSKNTLI